jgi:hypothetical protein
MEFNLNWINVEQYNKKNEFKIDKGKKKKQTQINFINIG